MKKRPSGAIGSTLGSRQSFLQKLFSQRILVLMSVPFLIHLLIFAYVPIWGWIMAFQEYKPARSIFDQTWVGLKQFIILFRDRSFYKVLRNTIAISTIKLVLGTFFSIFLAVMLNETWNRYFKKTVQTISYLPHFISWVVAANLVMNALSPDGGIVNDLLLAVGVIRKPVAFLGKPEYFWWIIGWSHVWKEVGWGAIIYLAAMAGIDPQLYEAATMDGVNRLQKIYYITLPGIRPTIIILLIINIGYLLQAGFEQVFLLRNDLVRDYSEIFTIYVLKYGIQMSRYSLATAAGIFRSLVSIMLITLANRIAARFGEETLY